MSSFLLKILLPSGLWCSSVSAIAVWKIKDIYTTKLVFGNYQDYIAPEVAVKFKEKYNVSLDYFETDENLKEKFDKKFYDLSIASTPVLDELIKNKSISEINWEKFSTLGDTDLFVSSHKESYAKSFFSDATRDILDSNSDFLKYGIPYFLSKFSFYYTGSKIPELSKEVSFGELVEIISKEPRFKSRNGIPKLAMIDDSRTLLSFARLVNNKEINPSKNEYKNSDDILNDYKSLIDKGLNESKLGKNFLLLNPNSSTVVDSLASGAIAGAFMYNGDGFFALTGGNLGVNFKKEDFHTVQIKDNLISLDFLVFSKNLTPEKETIVYKVAKDLLFNGYNSPDILAQENKISDISCDKVEDNGEDKLDDENSSYMYTPAKNFDFVQYTPTLKPLEKKIFCKDKFLKSDDPLDCLKKFILKIKALSVSNRFNKSYIPVEKFYEHSLDENVKNDIVLAYQKFKSFL